MKKKSRFKKIGNVSDLRYGVLHSQVGFSDGVSIVMKQVEEVLKKHHNVKENNILYLVGKSGESSFRVTENEILWDRNSVNRLMIDHFQKGYGGALSEKIEAAILEAKDVITKWIVEKKVDVLIVHNFSHPANFVSAVALSRYYRDSFLENKHTPKYILWWHDSHMERVEFENPARDVNNYLLEGVPGKFVEHVMFINNLQFKDAKSYFLKIDTRNVGFYNKISSNHDVAYNTTETFIDSFSDLDSLENENRVKKFIEDFGVEKFLKSEGMLIDEVLFCLQHTRLVDRKRIDFALEYCHLLLKKRKEKKAIYFLVSGQEAPGADYKKDLSELNVKLTKKIGSKVFLVFAEDYYKKTKLLFEEYPRIFAKLGGFSTYFSEVEGFGNNLLEVLASGLIPIVYKYPVFREDIEKYNFGLLALSEFKVRNKDLEKTWKIIGDKEQRRQMVEHNLKVLKENFSHKTLVSKLLKAITSARSHY